jgi:uncharacterized OB-fold protein
MMAIIRCKVCGKVCAASRGELCAACSRRTRRAEVKAAEEEIRRATGVERRIIRGAAGQG